MEKYIHRFASVIVLSVAIISGCPRPQLQLTVNESKNQIEQNDDPYIIIPFDLIDDKVLLDAEINDVKGKLCFEISRRGLQINPKHFNTNPMEGALTLLKSGGFNSDGSYNVQIGDLKANFQTVKSLDSDNFIDFDIPVLAFVGRDLFSNAELAIDYNSKIITVFPLHERSSVKSLLLIG